MLNVEALAKGIQSEDLSLMALPVHGFYAFCSVKETAPCDWI